MQYESAKSELQSPPPRISLSGILFEAGYHGSRPDKEIELGGLPVRARVDASGAFARFGLRLGLS